MATTTAKLVEQYVELHREKNALVEQTDALKNQIKTIEAELLKRWESADTTQMKAFNATVYVHREIWPKNLVDSPYTVACLKAAGLSDLVSETHNSSRLAGYIREIKKGAEIHQDGLPVSCEQLKTLLPEALQPAIDVTEKITLRVRS
jgi:hypothetical protein